MTIPQQELISVTFVAQDVTPGTYNFNVEYKVGGFEADGYSPKDLTPDDATIGAKTISVTITKELTGAQAITGVTAPEKNAVPDTDITAPANTTASIKWYKDGENTEVAGNFAGDTVYQAVINIKPDTGYVFGDVSFTVDGVSNWTKSDKQSDGSYNLSKTFDKTAGKETPSYTVPTGLIATYGDKLSDVALPSAANGTWSWMDGTQFVGNAGSQTHQVKFTPNDTANYLTVENIDVTVTVSAKTLTDVDIAAIADQPYTGTAIQPVPVVTSSQTIDSYTLVKDTDYTVEYGTNIAVGSGSGSVTVKAKSGGNYSFTDVSKTFNIVAAASTISITGDPGKEYDGTAVANPAVNKSGSTGTVSYTYYKNAECTTLTSTSDGAVSDGAAPKNTGNYWVKATVAADANYGSAISAAKAFTISAKPLTDDMITIGEQEVYNGTLQYVKNVTVKDGATPLAVDTDYTITGGNTATNVADTTLTITGKGNYTGEATKSWSLQKATPVEGDFTITTDLTKDYTGNPISVTAPTTSKAGMGSVAVKYDGSETAPTNAGSYTVTFDVAEGQNYTSATGLSIGTLKINAVDVSTLTPTAPDQTTVVNVGTFTDPTVTGVNSESVAGTFKYAYDALTNQSHDDVVNMLKGKSANAEVTLSYTFTPSDPNYTGTKGGSFKVTVKDIEFKVGAVDASAANAINTLIAETTYGKTWSERISVKSDAITASVGGVTKTGTYTIVPDSGLLTARPGVGTQNYTVKFTSDDGAYSNVTVFTGSITVTAKSVTITGLSASDKEYDGNDTATPTGTAVIDGKLDGDTVTVTAGTAKFADKNVGTGKTVTFTGYSLSGTDAANYSLSGQPASVTANITAKPVTITGVTATNRDYAAGNTTVALTGGTVNGVISGDTVTVDLSGATGTMANADAGTNKAVTVTGAALGGADATNYSLSAQPTGVTVTINKVNHPTYGTTKTDTTYAIRTVAGTKDYALPCSELAGVSYSVTGKTTANIVDTADPSISGNTLTYTSKVCGTADLTDTITIKITSTNYNDITLTLTVSASNKRNVIISGLSAATGLTYNGSAQAGYTGTATYSPAWTGTPVVTYYLNDGTTKTTPANSGATGEGLAPKNAGNYKVTIAIPDSDPTYTGNVTLAFEIAQKDVTVKPKDFTITKGNAIPVFALEYIGLVGSDTLTIAPGPEFICVNNDGAPVSTDPPAGTYIITWKNAGDATFTGDENYNVTTTTTGKLTINNPAPSGGGGGGVTTYSITADSAQNGTVTVSPKSASKGTTVTVTVKPDEGYELDTLTVTDKDGKAVTVTEKDGKYTFTMPASKVTVKAAFVEIEKPVVNPFVDVKEGGYFYDAVLWAAENGITGGVDDTHFAPNATCTRAQAVTFLWRAAGSPAPKSGVNPFTDVKAGSYYYDAVLWAVENGITDGTSATTFSPDAPCSRAQIVTFLWRSQKSPVSDSVNPFTDVAADSYYANAVVWAAENGITGGIGGGLFGPDNDCTRAQIVAFLYRFFVK